MTVTNVPVTVLNMRDSVQATICFGTLMRFAPTFDSRAGLMALHPGGAVRAAVPPATQLRFFVDEHGMFTINRGNGWVPLALPEVAAMLRNRRWTVDTRRGVLVVEP
jgi:hypothetical protein